MSSNVAGSIVLCFCLILDLSYYRKETERMIQHPDSVGHSSSYLVTVSDNKRNV